MNYLTFQDTVTIDTVFGPMKIKYLKPLIDPWTQKEVDSRYLAIMLDGDFNGWNSHGGDRSDAGRNLLSKISERYISDKIRKYEKDH